MHFVCIILTKVAWGKEEGGFVTHLFPRHFGTVRPVPWINGYPHQKGQIYFPSGLHQVLAVFACVCRISEKAVSRPSLHTPLLRSPIHSPE